MFLQNCSVLGSVFFADPSPPHFLGIPRGDWDHHKHFAFMFLTQHHSIAFTPNGWIELSIRTVNRILSTKDAFLSIFKALVKEEFKDNKSKTIDINTLFSLSQSLGEVTVVCLDNSEDVNQAYLNETWMDCQLDQKGIRINWKLYQICPENAEQANNLYLFLVICFLHEACHFYIAVFASIAQKRDTTDLMLGGGECTIDGGYCWEQSLFGGIVMWPKASDLSNFRLFTLQIRT